MFQFLKKQSAEDTKFFYNRLFEGKILHFLWGKSTRFDVKKISNKESVNKHLIPTLSPFITSNDVCLDFGCGPGSFLNLIAPLCNKIIGIDITDRFIIECKKNIRLNLIRNAKAQLLKESGEDLPFPDNYFDKVIMIDTIHHLQNPRKSFREISRVLKPKGMVIIFEPNIYNPLLALLCLLDKNEHGLLKLGRLSAYKKIFPKNLKIIQSKYNGTLIGPESKISLALADFVSSPKFRIFNWLSPKIFLVAKK